MLFGVLFREMRGAPSPAAGGDTPRSIPASPQKVKAHVWINGTASTATNQVRNVSRRVCCLVYTQDHVNVVLSLAEESSIDRPRRKYSPSTGALSAHPITRTHVYAFGRVSWL